MSTVLVQKTFQREFRNGSLIHRKIALILPKDRDTNMLVSRQAKNAGLVTLMEVKERQRMKVNAAMLVDYREQSVEADSEIVSTGLMESLSRRLSKNILAVMSTVVEETFQRKLRKELET